MRWKSSLMSVLRWQNYNYCFPQDLTELVTRVIKLCRSSFPLTELWIKYQEMLASLFSGHQYQTIASVQLIIFLFCSCCWNQKDKIIIFNIIKVDIWSSSNMAGFIYILFYFIFFQHFCGNFKASYMWMGCHGNHRSQIIRTPWWKQEQDRHQCEGCLVSVDWVGIINPHPSRVCCRIWLLLPKPDKVHCQIMGIREQLCG